MHGDWFYLYRAIDKEGNLVDISFSDTRDEKEAIKFLKQALKTSGVMPIQITTDKEPALYPALKKVFDNKVTHRDVKYLNNIIESDHRGIKSRWKVMKNFKNPYSALNFCTAFEEIRQFFKKIKSRAGNRRIFSPKFKEFVKLAKNCS